MTTEQKRQWLVALYPNSKPWQAKVKTMPDKQIIAIYLFKSRKAAQPQRKAS